MLFVFTALLELTQHLAKCLGFTQIGPILVENKSQGSTALKCDT